MCKSFFIFVLLLCTGTSGVIADYHGRRWLGEFSGGTDLLKLKIAKLIIFFLICPLVLSCHDSTPYEIDWSKILPEGSLTLGGQSPNRQVTRENLMGVVDTLFFNLYHLAGFILSADRPEASGYLRNAGFKSGYTDIRGTLSSDTSQSGQHKVEMDFTAEFNDFSRDSVLFMGGGLHFKSTYSNMIRAYDAFVFKSTINGRINFAGNYSGSCTFHDFNMVWSAWLLSYSGTIEMTSGYFKIKEAVEKQYNFP
ncbi:MAG TPA: hypothetical protein VJ417_10255 [Candidatus Glassbacteria bacterium]|nr:hypothetical protein [Candidatus Glassbacteria bacterium]